jgi:hypothetical protein
VITAAALGLVAVVASAVALVIHLEDVPAGRATGSGPNAGAASSSLSRGSERPRIASQSRHGACSSLATTAGEAIDKVNVFVAAFNAGQSTGPAEGPAVDALNNSAAAVSNGLSDSGSQQLRDAFNAYIDAARGVANAIGTHASSGEFNQRVNQLNDTRTKALNLCQGS